MRRAFFLLLLAATAAFSPHATRAQSVQRCVGPDGSAIYTDRRCDDIGAVQRIPPPSAAQGARLVRGGCPRQLSHLVGEIGGAIQSRDVNRLSAVYDWRGVSKASATRLFDQLEAIVGRPLVDIAPVYRQPETAPFAGSTRADASAAGESAPGDAAKGPQAWMPSWRQAPATDADTSADASGSVEDADPSPATMPTRPYPVALRVEQTLGRSGTTPTRTVFGLRRAYGCFWVSL